MAARHPATPLDQSSLGTARKLYNKLGIRSPLGGIQHPVKSCSDSNRASILMMQFSALFYANDDPRVNYLLCGK